MEDTSKQSLIRSAIKLSPYIEQLQSVQVVSISLQEAFVRCELGLGRFGSFGS